MKQHFCPAEQSMVAFEKECNWCGEQEISMIEVLKQMVEALECALSDDKPYIDKCKQAIQAGKKTIAQLESQEPVAHPVIAGVLFDFMGWLTSRKERIVLSSADNASPAVEAITEFAKMRNLSLDDAKVQDWHTHPPQRTEQNFCSRCGKRTADLTTIHTCTPPQD
jgi:hypothetical protein